MLGVMFPFDFIDVSDFVWFTPEFYVYHETSIEQNYYAVKLD